MAKKSYYKYANRMADSQVNWAEVASDMNTMLSETQALRQARRDQIDEASRQFGETLSNAPQGEAVNINQYALDHADNAQQFMLMQDQLLKSGKLKLRDYNLGRTNLEQGTRGLFETMKEAQEQYKIKMERAKASGVAVQNPDGTFMVGSQKLESWLMEEVEAFGNFNNTSAFINPTNGMVSIMKRKSADGKAQGRTVTGQAIGDVPDVRTMAPAGQTPSDFLTIQQLRQNVTQKFDKYDLSAGLADQVKNLADSFVTAALDPENKYYGKITSVDDLRDIPEYDNAKKQLIQEIKANEYNAASILTNTAVKNANGDDYTYTRNPELQGELVFPVSNLTLKQKEELTKAGVDVTGVNVKYDDVLFKLQTNTLTSAQMDQKEEAILLIDNPSQMSAGMPVPVFTDDQNKRMDEVIGNRFEMMIKRDMEISTARLRTEFSPYDKPAFLYGLEEKQETQFGYLREIEAMQTKNQAQFKNIVETRIEAQNVIRRNNGEKLMIKDVEREKGYFDIVLQDPNNPASRRVERVDRYEKKSDDTYDFTKPLSKKEVSKKLAQYLVPLEGSFSGVYDNYIKTEGEELDRTTGQPLAINQTSAKGGIADQTLPAPIISAVAQNEGRIESFRETPSFVGAQGFAEDALSYMDNIGIVQGNGAQGTNTYRVTTKEDTGPGGGNEGTMTITVNGVTYTPSSYNAIYKNNRFESNQLNGIEGFVQYVLNQEYAKHNAEVKKGQPAQPAQPAQPSPAPSDIRLKKNYNIIGTSENGYNIYEFEYIDSKKYGEGVYQGVMAQEVPHASILLGDYYHVDYKKLDVEFKRIK